MRSTPSKRGPIGPKVGGILGAAAAAAVVVHLVTPKPAALACRRLGAMRPAARRHRSDDLARYSLKVLSHGEQDYGSSFPRGVMDVYSPIGDPGTAHPVVFWLHGGGYVGGGRKDTAAFATMLASRGFVVANVDYARAPECCYPTPVVQLGEAYRYLEANAERFSADMGRVAFGGDTTGGQIAGQFVNVQISQQYAAAVAVPPVVSDPHTVRAAVFYCVPFNMRRFDFLSGRDGVPGQRPVPVMGRLAWSYFGDRHWRSSEQAALASLLDSVAEGFPPSYLTDAPQLSFSPQAPEMAAKLRIIGTPVVTYLPGSEPMSEGPASSSEGAAKRLLTPDYVYDMSLPQAFRNFELTSSFLRERLCRR